VLYKQLLHCRVIFFWFCNFQILVAFIFSASVDRQSYLFLDPSSLLIWALVAMSCVVEKNLVEIPDADQKEGRTCAV